MWFSENLVSLHSGTSPIMSQTVLTLMFAVLGVLLVGIGFGYTNKSKKALGLHRWTLTTVLIITLIPLFGVMIPTMYAFYVDPDVAMFSSISLTQVAHAAVSIPALGTAVIYSLGRLPSSVKRSMRWTAILWIASIFLGVMLFLQMMDSIPTF